MRNGFIAGAEWADQNPNWISVKEKEPPESIAWDKRIFCSKSQSFKFFIRTELNPHESPC
jgi:hypothetical protein